MRAPPPVVPEPVCSSLLARCGVVCRDPSLGRGRTRSPPSAFPDRIQPAIGSKHRASLCVVHRAPAYDLHPCRWWRALAAPGGFAGLLCVIGGRYQVPLGLGDSGRLLTRRNHPVREKRRHQSQPATKALSRGAGTWSGHRLGMRGEAAPRSRAYRLPLLIPHVTPRGEADRQIRRRAFDNAAAVGPGRRKFRFSSCRGAEAYWRLGILRSGPVALVIGLATSVLWLGSFLGGSPLGGCLCAVR